MSDWRTLLHDLFAGTVGQNSLEEAADQMMSYVDPTYEDKCLDALDKAIEAANAGDHTVCECINASHGYMANDPVEAARLLMRFRGVFLAVRESRSQ